MANPTLRTAVGNYGHTKPLKDGAAVSPRFDMEHIDVSPVTWNSTFRKWPSPRISAPAPMGRLLPESQFS